MWVMVDVESDGPCPGLYSMISIGAVTFEGLTCLKRETFYAKLSPITGRWEEEALKVCGFTRAETETFDNPLTVMKEFEQWLTTVAGPRPMFISDNNGFDWQFVNYYFHYYLGRNPFGHSSTNLGSLYKGLVKNTRKNFKHLRKTKHSHNPVDDATGNVEALYYMVHYLGLKI